MPDSPELNPELQALDFASLSSALCFVCSGMFDGEIDMVNHHEKVSIEDVRRFWTDNPLFEGELQLETGSKKWFEEWERIITEDAYLGEGPGPIFYPRLSQNSRIVDVGCGPGFWVRWFLRRGFYNVSACDLTDRAVELTKRSLNLFGLVTKGEIRVGNAEDLPWPDHTFDHVNCQGVIHHTPNTEKCIQEFHRVLKPAPTGGGTLCFSVYYKGGLLRHPKMLKLVTQMARQFIKTKGRGRESMLWEQDPEEIVRLYDGRDNPLGKAYSLEELRRMVTDFFDIIELRRFYFPVRWVPGYIPRAVHRWLDHSHGFLMIARCQRKT